MNIRPLAITAFAAALSVGGGANAATLVASYLFNNTLNSSVAGAPALVLTDPTHTSGFATDTVFGTSRTVLHIGGTAFPTTNQGGLTFDSTGLVSPDNYSVALSFKFEGGDGVWRRILDVENRQSDNGFYVDPSNHLDIFPVSGSNVTFTTNTYQNVVLTVGPGGDVNAYLQGVGSFHTTTTIMNINNANNPDDLIHIFLDNVIAGGQGEWSPADIAVANFYSGVLSPADVAAFQQNPLAPPPPPGVPEPSTWALTILGFGALGAVARRRRRDRALLA